MKKYHELPLVDPDNDDPPTRGIRHAWREFGAGDEFGSLNHITPAAIVAAARLVRKGKVFALTLPLDSPTMTPTRPLYKHNVLVERNGRDDSLDSFFMSHTSQWDGLRHVKFRQHGYYGGRTDEEIDRTGELGIDRVSARGIVGRGVLIDMLAYKAARGEAWDPHQRYKITASELDQVLALENVELEAGDILLLRTGWWPSRLGMSEDELSQMEGSAGLDPSNETAAWLWDHQVAAVAADNGAVECSPLLTKTEGFLHYRLIPTLGMFLGELFDLEALAADCAEDAVYSGLLVSSPLRIPHGVCSPPNAYLIK